MRRRLRSIVLTIILLGLIFGAVGGAVGAALKNEPSFYRQPSPYESWEVTERASAFVTRVQDFKNDVPAKADWSGTFHGDDLDCFLRENLSEEHGFGKLLPAGFHSPRVTVDGDRIRLGVQYGHDFWSTVVWVELRPWLVKNDVNVIGLELVGLKAGGLPISCQTLLDSLSELAHESNVDVTWYRHDGNPVGLFRFYADQLRPTTQIHTFKVGDGAVTIGGRTRIDPTPTVNPLGD